MQLMQLKRVFKYNGLTLDDPGASLSPERAKEVFALTYPELMTAAVEGPVVEGGCQVYTFARATRDKG